MHRVLNAQSLRSKSVEIWGAKRAEKITRKILSPPLLYAHAGAAAYQGFHQLHECYRGMHENENRALEKHFYFYNFNHVCDTPHASKVVELVLMPRIRLSKSIVVGIDFQLTFDFFDFDKAVADALGQGAQRLVMRFRTAIHALLLLLCAVLCLM